MVSVGNLNTMTKIRIVTLTFLLVTCLCFGVVITMVFSQMNKLEELHKLLDGQKTKMLATEELVRQFHNDYHVSLRRKRSETNDLSPADGVNNLTHLTQLEKEPVSTKGGAVYARWGRSVCESSAELVYEGIVGGGWYDHTGSAVNPLCVVREPKWNKYVDGFQDNAAYLYGAEYEGSLPDTIMSSNVKTLVEANLPCAVCRASLRSVSIMVPGRNDCFVGWTLEYEGYLMAGHYAQKMSSQYICVDEAPEATEAGYRNENGHLFYIVEAHCGSPPVRNMFMGVKLRVLFVQYKIVFDF